MTGLFVLVGLAFTVLLAGASARKPVDAPRDGGATSWLNVLTDDVSLMRPWLLAAPVCWVAALALIEASGSVATSDPMTQAALLFGALPLVGGLASGGLALLRASRAAERVSVELEHGRAALVLAASSATAFGTAGGLTVRAFQAVLSF